MAENDTKKIATTSNAGSVWVFSIIALSLSWFNVILFTAVADISARLFFNNPYTGLRIKGAAGQAGLIIGLFGFIAVPISLICLFKAWRHFMGINSVWARPLFFAILIAFMAIPLNYFVRNIDFDMTRPKNKFVWDEAVQKYKVVPIHDDELMPAQNKVNGR